MQDTGGSGFGTVKFTGTKSFGCKSLRFFHKEFSYKVHHGFLASPQLLNFLAKWAKHTSDALHRATKLLMSYF